MYGNNGWESTTETLASLSEVDDFEEFDESTSYSVGDIVRKNSKLYIFTANHQGEWSDGDVSQTNVVSILEDIIESSSPKPFTLLTTPTNLMTTVAELATTGLTKATMSDIAAGKYTGILDPSLGLFSLMFARLGKNSYYIVYGYDVSGGGVDEAIVFSVTIESNDSVTVTRFER